MERPEELTFNAVSKHILLGWVISDMAQRRDKDQKNCRISHNKYSFLPLGHSSPVLAAPCGQLGAQGCLSVPPVTPGWICSWGGAGEGEFRCHCQCTELWGQRVTALCDTSSFQDFWKERQGKSHQNNPQNSCRRNETNVSGNVNRESLE